MIVKQHLNVDLTPQYKQLEVLYKEYQDKDFVIVGFPANNFLWQEPDTDQGILHKKLWD